MTNGYQDKQFMFDISYLCGEDLCVFEFGYIPDNGVVWNMFKHVGGCAEIWKT